VISAIISRSCGESADAVGKSDAVAAAAAAPADGSKRDDDDDEDVVAVVGVDICAAAV
jgi:hypothetical protein